MGSNFLLKEENYRKINAELEVKTNELMKEYESLMTLQNHASSSSTHQQTASRGSAAERQVDKRGRKHSVTTGPPRSSVARPTHYVQHCPVANFQETNTRAGDIISLHKVDSKGDGELLGADKGLGTEALISYLRANVKVLQEEVQSLQGHCKTRVEACREHEAQLKCTEEESAKWRQLATSGKEQLRKLEHQCSVAATKQHQRETENLALRKEIESLRKELKTCTQAASSTDVRLNRSLEEIEKLKTSVKQLKYDKKELQDEGRKKTNELLSLVKRLERQKMELISGFKKQMQLVDNLARQKMQLEAGRVVEFTEKEFLKLLDTAPENEERS